MGDNTPTPLGQIIDQALADREAALAKLASVNGKSVEENRLLVQRVAYFTGTSLYLVVNILYTAALEEYHHADRAS